MGTAMTQKITFGERTGAGALASITGTLPRLPHSDCDAAVFF